VETGSGCRRRKGVRKGSVISPVLANLLPALRTGSLGKAWRKKEARGEMIIVRYADDGVHGVRATRRRRASGAVAGTLRKFGLELHPEKTRLIEFGRYAAERREKRREGKPETFNFLGFTHICGTKPYRRAKFTVHRRTIRQADGSQAQKS